MLTFEKFIDKYRQNPSQFIGSDEVPEMEKELRIREIAEMLPGIFLAQISKRGEWSLLLER